MAFSQGADRSYRLTEILFGQSISDAKERLAEVFHLAVPGLEDIGLTQSNKNLLFRSMEALNH